MTLHSGYPRNLYQDLPASTRRTTITTALAVAAIPALGVMVDYLGLEPIDFTGHPRAWFWTLFALAVIGRTGCLLTIRIEEAVDRLTGIVRFLAMTDCVRMISFFVWLISLLIIFANVAGTATSHEFVASVALMVLVPVPFRFL